MNEKIWKMRTFRTVLLLCMTFLLLITVCGKNQAAADQPDDDAAISQENAESIPIEIVSTDGFTMNYFRFGQGDKTFVMLPGLSVQGVMQSAEQIASAYQPLTEDFTIYVFDPRNELPESYSVTEMAQDTASVLNALGLENVYIMGASMGGMTALEMEATHPELIEKMVLASSAVQMKEEQFRVIDEWIRLAQEGNAEDLYLAFGKAVYPEEVFEQAKEALKAAAETVTEDELQHFVILADSLKNFDVTDKMDKIECPVLAVNDKGDQVLGAEAVETMEQYMSLRPDWDFYMYDGYGHALYDTAPDFKDRMLEFFTGQ